MDAKQIMNIFRDTAYVRMGGSMEELKAAEYLQGKCAELGLAAEIVPFDVDMATIQEAKLFIDGEEIPCKGYFNAGNADLEAPFYYLRADDQYSLSQCRGKIVMIDGYMRHWLYQDLMENGALGFISYDGNANYADRDIDQRELRAQVHKGNKIPGVNINVKDAIGLIQKNAGTAKIVLRQHEYVGQSRNVVLDLPGEIYSEEYALPVSSTQQDVLELIGKLHDREDIDGIMVQMPLPPHMDAQAVLRAVRPDKDLDCVHPYNLGQLMLGQDAFQPCTPAGVMRLTQPK